MPPADPETVRGWHAHVYFDGDSIDAARALCDEAERRLPVARGRMHEKAVGPHPCWSCQLAFEPGAFATVVPWLALNRGDLRVLVHPQTGDDLRDHRDHALWLGGEVALELSIFESRDG